MPRSRRQQNGLRSEAFEPSYQRLVRDLLGQILRKELPAGTKLPDERELARLHGVSRCTVRNAMHVLDTRGLVHRVPSKGTFVIGTPAEARWFSSARTILLIQWSTEPLPANCFYGRIHQGVRQMVHALGLDLRVESIGTSVHVPLNRYVPPAPSQVSGVIVCGMIDEQYIGMFCSEGIPVVVADYRAQRSDVDCVEIDVETEAADIAGHLVERGHRVMGLVALARRDPDNTVVQDPDVRRLLDSVRRFQGRFRIEVPEDLAITAAGLSCAEESIRHLLALPNRPGALLCFHEDLIAPLFRTLAQIGLRCPEDISVVARAAAGAADRTVTHLAGEPEFMGRSAVRLLLDRIKSPHSPSIKLAVGSRLVRGTTTGPVPRARPASESR